MNNSFQHLFVTAGFYEGSWEEGIIKRAGIFGVGVGVDAGGVISENVTFSRSTV